MPSKAIYLDDITYKKVEEISQMKGAPMGAIMADWIRLEAAKSRADEERPRGCQSNHDFLPIKGKLCWDFQCGGDAVLQIGQLYYCAKHTLQWHLTADDNAQLYCVCLRCFWKWSSEDFYTTKIWGF